MPYVPAANVAGVQLIMSYGGQTIENNFYFHHNTQPTASDLEDLVGLMEQWRVDHMRQFTNVTLAFQKWIASDLTVQNGVGIEVPILVSQNGLDSSGHATPGNVAVCVKLSTGLRGRSYRGRVYLAGITSSQVIDGFVGSAFITAAQTAFDNLISTLGAAGWTMSIVSRYHGVDANGKPIPRAAAVVTPVLNATVDNKSDSQRRRLPGRGQ